MTHCSVHVFLTLRLLLVATPILGDALGHDSTSRALLRRESEKRYAASSLEKRLMRRMRSLLKRTDSQTILFGELNFLNIESNIHNCSSDADCNFAGCGATGIAVGSCHEKNCFKSTIPCDDPDGTNYHRDSFEQINPFCLHGRQTSLCYPHGCVDMALPDDDSDPVSPRTCQEFKNVAGDKMCSQGSMQVLAELFCRKTCGRCAEHRACAAPTVENQAGLGACSEGVSINSGATCNTQCAAGFKPSVVSLACMNGRLRPTSFKCELPTVSENLSALNAERKKRRPSSGSQNNRRPVHLQKHHKRSLDNHTKDQFNVSMCVVVALIALAGVFCCKTRGSDKSELGSEVHANKTNGNTESYGASEDNVWHRHTSSSDHLGQLLDQEARPVWRWHPSNSNDLVVEPDQKARLKMNREIMAVTMAKDYDVIDLARRNKKVLRIGSGATSDGRKVIHDITCRNNGRPLCVVSMFGDEQAVFTCNPDGSADKELFKVCKSIGSEIQYTIGLTNLDGDGITLMFSKKYGSLWLGDGIDMLSQDYTGGCKLLAQTKEFHDDDYVIEVQPGVDIALVLAMILARDQRDTVSGETKQEVRKQRSG